MLSSASFLLAPLDAVHDRTVFSSDSESLNCYLPERARALWFDANIVSRPRAAPLCSASIHASVDSTAAKRDCITTVNTL
jgi:hypothetical protein